MILVETLVTAFVAGVAGVPIGYEVRRRTERSGVRRKAADELEDELRQLGDSLPTRTEWRPVRNESVDLRNRFEDRLSQPALQARLSAISTLALFLTSEFGDTVREGNRLPGERAMAFAISSARQGLNEFLQHKSHNPPPFPTGDHLSELLDEWRDTGRRPAELKPVSGGRADLQRLP